MHNENIKARSKDRAMEKYRILSRHVIDAPFVAEIGCLEWLKERR
jgi:hypothetical protein